MNRDFRTLLVESRLGDKPLPSWCIGAIRGIFDQGVEGESVIGVMPCDNGYVLCATSHRLLIVSRDGLEEECQYGQITNIEATTGWFSRGIDISLVDDGYVSVGTNDRDAVIAMDNLLREMSPHIDASEATKREGGGLTGLAKGVFNTATGGDIRKYEEFVDSATTVLVGLHQDQAALSAKLGEFDEAIAELRESDSISRERISNLEASMAELQTAQAETLENLGAVQDTLNALADEIRKAQSLIREIQASEQAQTSPSATAVKVALTASGAAVAISFVSIFLGLM